MGALIETIENHPVYKELKELSGMLEMAKGLCKESSDLADQWDRSNSIASYAHRLLDSADPFLIPFSTLNNLSSAFAQAKAEISAFVGNSNAAHWQNIQSHLDSALLNLVSIPAQSAPGIEQMRISAENYRSTISHLLDSIRADGDGVSRAQAELQNKINDATAEVQNQKQRIDNAIATFQQQFSEAQQARQNEFTAEKERRDNAETKAAEAAANTHAELIKDLNSKAANLLSEIEERKQHVQKLVGIIANTGMAYGFQKTANDERSAARLWQIVAACSLAIWIIAGCVFFALTYDKDLTLTAVARQFMISTPFVLLSGFAALQVSRHQRNERSMRQAELEIASIDPFLSTLSDEDRNAVKREFATRYFGQREVEPKQADAPPSNLVEVASTLAKLAQELVKKN